MEVLQHAPNVYAPNVRGAWLTDRTMLDHKTRPINVAQRSRLNSNFWLCVVTIQLSITAVVPLVEHNIVQYCLCRLE